MKTAYLVIATTVCLLGTAVSTQAGWSVEVESGAALNGYNDVRIPGNTGTDFSLTDDLTSDATAYFRGRATVDLGKRQRLSVLVAPLRIEAAGRVDRPIEYNGVTFAAGSDLRSRYRFDSYRLTWSYALVQSDRLRFDLGLTGKIRDAGIRVESSDQTTEKTNTGFVPLIHFALDWSLSPRYGLLFRGDALAAPQGRAEDVLAAIYTDLTNRVRLRIGYRLLEGGADNDEVYNFALVHYLGAGLTVRL